MASNRGGRRPAGRGRVAGARKRPPTGGPAGAKDKSSDVTDPTEETVVEARSAHDDLPAAETVSSDTASDDTVSDGKDVLSDGDMSNTEISAAVKAADDEVQSRDIGNDDPVTGADASTDRDATGELDDDDLDDDDPNAGDDEDDLEVAAELDDDDEDDDLDDDLDDDDDDDDLEVAAELDDDVEDDDLDDDDDDDLDDDEVEAEPVAVPVSGRRARAAAEREAAAEQKSPPNRKDAAKPGTKPSKKSSVSTAKKTGSTKATSSTAAGAGNRRGLMRFLREVIAELGKVVWPGRRELIVYTSVVIVFMTFMVALVAGLDILFAQGVLAVFG